MSLVTASLGKRKQIWLEFRYGSDTVARIKRVPGANFKERPFPHWAVPLSVANCHALREALGDMLEIDPSLARWYRQSVRTERRILAVHAADPGVPVATPVCDAVAPFLAASLRARGYQTLSPAFAAATGNHFIADQPGVGKTIETIASLVECGVKGPILVVAPQKALRATWRAQIGKWLAGANVAWQTTVADSEHGSYPERAALIDAYLARVKAEPATMNFLMVNAEMLRWQPYCDGLFDGWHAPLALRPCKTNRVKTCPRAKKGHSWHPHFESLAKQKWACVVLDETHKYMVNANERSGNVSQVGMGIQKLKVDTSQPLNKIGLSGTPFKGKPRKFWPILHWLRPDKYTGQWRWIERYFEMEEAYFAYDGKAVTDRMIPDRVEEFNKELSLIMIRRTKNELRTLNPAWAPPEKQYAEIVVDMDARQRRAYRQMVDSAMANLDNGLLTAEGILAELTRLKQLASAYGRLDAEGNFKPYLPSNKWEWIVEDFLEPRGIARENDGEGKVVIASQFTSLLDVFGADLKRMRIPFEIITGATAGRSVERIQDTWQKPWKPGAARVLLLSTQAGGVSLTLDAADELVLVDETWIPDEQEQVEDRIHRTGRTDHQVVIYRLVSEGTIDEAISTGNLEADEVQKRLLDGRRGVESKRLLLQGVGE